MRASKPFSTFAAAKISQNPLYSALDTNQYQPSPVNRPQPTIVTQPEGPQAKVIDLQELWGQVEANSPQKKVNKHEMNNIRIIELANDDVMMELSPDELEQVFGSSSKNDDNIQLDLKQQEPEDFTDIWQQIETQDAPKQSNKPKQADIDQETLTRNSNQPNSPSQKLPINQDKGLSLSKDFLMHDYKAFATTPFGANIHTHFAMTQRSDTQLKNYTLSDLKTGKVIIKCQAHTKNESQTSYNPVLDFILESGELLATAYPRQLINGQLYLLHLYNPYESCYREISAYIQTNDGYIGQSCYCNSTVYLGSGTSQERLCMVVGIRKGALITNMGLDGIKSAPYNCRLENARKAFVYLLGQMEQNRFVVRVGEGLSPLLGFAISVARKVYIDSFVE